MGRYDRKEKIIIKIKIRGSDNVEHTATALINCEASENFIDEQKGSLLWTT